jgi:RNA polymerase sigma factor (sigma-70 family)
LEPQALTSEEALWQGLRAGESSALEGLARLFYQPLLQYGTRFTADQELVKDSIQELLLTLWQQRTRLGDAGSVKLYLFKALRHRLFKEFRRLARFEAHWPDEHPTEAGSDEPPFVRQEAEARDHARLHLLLTQLSDRQREMLYLRYYENLTNEEIGQITGINRQSVANAIHRALSVLRDNWVWLVMVWWLEQGMVPPREGW